MEFPPLCSNAVPKADIVRCWCADEAFAQEASYIVMWQGTVHVIRFLGKILFNFACHVFPHTGVYRGPVS